MEGVKSGLRMLREDVTVAEVTEKEAEDRKKWRWKIRCGDPWWEKPKVEDTDS